MNCVKLFTKPHYWVDHKYIKRRKICYWVTGNPLITRIFVGPDLNPRGNFSIWMGRELFIGSEKLIFVAPVRIHDRFIECFESKTMEQSGNLKRKKKRICFWGKTCITIPKIETLKYSFGPIKLARLSRISSESCRWSRHNSDHEILYKVACFLNWTKIRIPCCI